MTNKLQLNNSEFEYRDMFDNTDAFTIAVDDTYLDLIEWCKRNCKDVVHYVAKNRKRISVRAVYEMLYLELPMKTLLKFGIGKTFKANFRQFARDLVLSIIDNLRSGWCPSTLMSR